MGWKDSTRRALVGEKVVLQSSGGELWIRPKKLSQEAVDAVREAKAKVASDPQFKDGLRRAMELRGRYPWFMNGEAPTQAQIDQVADADKAELFALNGVLTTAPKAELFRISLMHGIGEHNFADDSGALIGEGKTLPGSVVNDILDWSDLAAEIHAAVGEHNRPLASRSGSTSPTSPSGSTPAPSTDQIPGSSPTGGTR